MTSDSLVRGPLRNGALSSYLASLGWAVPSSGIRVSQFSHGQSNPTFLIEAGSRKVVLRKKPDGELLRSAHAVEREYAIQRALKGTGVPVPEMLSLCEDSQILGTPFYLMEFVDGSVHTNPRLPDHTPQQRTQAYTAAIDVLAKLHSLDLESLGLEGFGQQLNYCSRQVRRWWLQYRRSAQAAAEPELPSMQQLARLLQQRIPPADADPAAVSVVHGDFRLDNLVFDRADRTCVRAVLDWELSTLGNAMSDVAFFCLPFHLPEHVPVIGHVPPSVPGIPSEQRLLERYCATRGIPVPEPQHWAFYLALSLFRAAAILAGVGARAKHGNAAAANAATVGARTVVDALAQRALTLLNASTRGRPSAVPFSDPGEPSGKDRHTSGGAGFEPSGRVRPILASLKCFMQDHIYPAERIFQEHARSQDRWSVCPEMERLKQKAKQQRLWNLWISSSLAESMEAVLEAGAVQEEAALLRGRGLTNVEYAMCAEVMGASVWASEVFNCSAPDTGNMEVLARYGTLDQQRRWLLPLLRGEMRSCFAMTEPDVASSDATNICATIARVPGSDMLQLDGRKWWISGACDPRCSVAIFMGKSNTSGPIHRQQSMVLVPMPAPGVEVVRPLEVFGFDDAPHGHAEMTFTNVQVPASNLILGEGRGFEIAQGRLGPGRLHHCMRLIGMGERAMLLAATRALSRVAFGKPLAQQGGLQMDLARARVQLAAARLLVLQAALQLDLHGNKVARDAIAAAKVAAPSAVLHVLDTAIQVHGGMGVCQDTPLATMWAGARTLRMADGPDEVHLRSLAVSELRSAASARPKL